MHRSVYLQTALVALLAGVTLISYVSIPELCLWSGIIIAGACLLYGRPKANLAGLTLLIAVAGMYRYQLVRADTTPLYWLAVDKADVSIAGYMDGGLKQSESGWSFYVHAIAVNGSRVSERLLVRLSHEPQGRYGDGMHLTGRLGRVSSFDDFDYPAYLRKEGVRAVMIHPHVDGMAVAVSLPRSIWIRVVRAVYDIRDAFTASVRRAVPEPEASYLVGILVGGRAELGQDIVDNFSRTSTSHVLAISGYNITILTTAVTGLLIGWLGRRRGMFITVFVIVLFVVMTGAGASVVRAALMGVLALVAGSLGRQAHIGTIILLSAAVMVIVNPLILRDDVGFQLSFAALVGLVYLEPIISGYMGRLGTHWLGRIIAATTAAQIAVLPLILYYFHTLSVVGPLANVLILPLVPLAMALGFVTGLVGLLVWPIAHAIGLLAWAVAWYQLQVVQYLAGLSWSAFELYINPQIVVAFYGILAIWWHLEKKPESAYSGEALNSHIHV